MSNPLTVSVVNRRSPPGRRIPRTAARNAPESNSLRLARVGADHLYRWTRREIERVTLTADQVAESEFLKAGLTTPAITRRAGHLDESAAICEEMLDVLPRQLQVAVEQRL